VTARQPQAFSSRLDVRADVETRKRLFARLQKTRYFLSMKQLIRIGVVCLTIAAAALGCSLSLAAKSYAVGDTGPAGGLIFFVKSSMTSGWQYLEVAPTDQGTIVQWAADNITTGAVGTLKGTGKTNTTTIVGIETVANAAQLCDNLVLNGYSDWFLPSFDELDEIFFALSTMGLGNLVPGVNYWTSTENTSTQAYAGSYVGGTSVVAGNHNKSVAGYVRAVRSF
jgi:hypothetical protein